MRGVLLIFMYLYLANSLVALGQNKEFGSTSSTSLNPTHKADKEREKETLLAWIKNKPQNLMLGNRCMEEATKEMGFEYILQPKGLQYNHNEFERLIHNFGVKMSLFFKNGPFWKFKLKKKRKECRENISDFTG